MNIDFDCTIQSFRCQLAKWLVYWFVGAIIGEVHRIRMQNLHMAKKIQFNKSFSLKTFAIPSFS